MAAPEWPARRLWNLAPTRWTLLMWWFGDVDSRRRLDPCRDRALPAIAMRPESAHRIRRRATASLAAGWVDAGNPVRFLVSGTEGYALHGNDQFSFRVTTSRALDGRPLDATPGAIAIH